MPNRSVALNSGGLLPKTGEYPWRVYVSRSRPRRRSQAVTRIMLGYPPKQTGAPRRSDVGTARAEPQSAPQGDSASGHPMAAGLRGLDEEHAAREVDALPLEPQDLAAAHAGVERDGHDRREVAALRAAAQAAPTTTKIATRSASTR